MVEPLDFCSAVQVIVFVSSLPPEQPASKATANAAHTNFFIAFSLSFIMAKLRA